MLEQSDLWQLTAEQRQQIYEEEKNRVEEAAPLFSKRTKIIAAVYLLGCLLLLSGVSNAMLSLWCDHTWKFKPEIDLFDGLVESTVILIRPFLAVLVTAWTIAIPIGFIIGLWLWGADAFKLFKRFTERAGFCSRRQ